MAAFAVVRSPMRDAPSACAKYVIASVYGRRYISTRPDDLVLAAHEPPVLAIAAEAARFLGRTV